MLCYRDRTYCDAPCAAQECSRMITPEVEAAAARAGLPLAISDLRNECSGYRPIPGEDGRDNARDQ